VNSDIPPTPNKNNPKTTTTKKQQQIIDRTKGVTWNFIGVNFGTSVLLKKMFHVKCLRHHDHIHTSCDAVLVFVPALLS